MAVPTATAVGQPDSEHPDRRGELMSAALELGDSVGKAVACRALGVPRASLYRRMQPSAPRRVRPKPARALDVAERQTVLDHLHSERFCEVSFSIARFTHRLCCTAKYRNKGWKSTLYMN